MTWHWENTYGLLWLLILPAVALLAWQAYRSNRAKWQRAANPLLLQTWKPFGQRPISILFVILCMAILFLVLAYANPQGGSREAKGYSRNQNVVFVMDLSQSMKAPDVKPDRLERAKLFSYDILERLQGQRVALVVFAGHAYLHLPLTTDYAACALFISNITPEMIPAPGTAIANALDQSLSAITSGSYADATSAIVLITDGEDHDKGALAMAQKIKKEGFALYAVGAGTVKGAPVPERNGQGVKRDDHGNPVISRLNETFLKKLAAKGGGKYYNTVSGKRAAAGLANDINKVDSGKQEKTSFSIREEWYSVPLGMALLVLIASFFTREILIKTLKDVD